MQSKPDKLFIGFIHKDELSPDLFTLKLYAKLFSHLGNVWINFAIKAVCQDIWKIAFDLYNSPVP